MNAEISAKFATFTAALTMTGLIVVAVASMFDVPVPQRIVRANPVDDARSIHRGPLKSGRAGGRAICLASGRVRRLPRARRVSILICLCRGKEKRPFYP